MSVEEKQAITEVLYRYARAVDRKDFAAVAACYFPDANDNHGGYNGNADGLVEDMKVRHRTIDSSQHFVTNVLIDLGVDVANVESYCLCYLRLDKEPGAESQLLSTIRCRYVDRFEKRDGEWRIADRIVVFDESRQEMITDSLNPLWVASKRNSSDPVYTRLP
ncbi:hypothetical protein ART_3455 [Arthrobacter sp. PAMC 25486]|uniref:nuclear transport factor 2 family protein n=1 Tax=Arthrobacter sp. PAMC 25486 TaxID=1494608 RepID=UPI0005360159|nr:nuclear transport factor 2 family protein [Arthrobacter sp. PAMC 25486]AIY03054.1 hypothetical protein ART_3455 [Arthrobacter sp. PAMC 25486]